MPPMGPVVFDGGDFADPPLAAPIALVGLAILGLIVIINTVESLASKSTLLARFALLVPILFRPERLTAARPVRPVALAGSRPRP